MKTMTSVRSIADISEGRILAAVDVAALPDHVFRALTESDEIVRWWGADDVYRTTGWIADLRVGGRWRADGHEAGGKSFSVEGEFLTISPPKMLSQTWKADWDEGRPTALIYSLEETEKGTRVTLRHEGFKNRPESCHSYTDAWGMVLQWLERHFAPEPAVIPPRFFLLRLNPPRPTFPENMNAMERAVMQEHSAYWAEFLKQGTAVVYGPVEDSKGTWGVAIVRVLDEQASLALAADDPAIRSGLGFRYDISPMPRAFVGG